MTPQTCNPTFENISQRVVFSYQRQMPEFAPVLPEPLSPSEQGEMRASQKALDALFRALYRCAYDQPETFGLLAANDVYTEDGSSKEHQRYVTKQVRKARDKLVAGVDYLYHVGRWGTLVKGQLRLAPDDYASFFAKSPRVRQKLVKGMHAVGLTVSEQEDAVRVSNTQYPSMMLALQTLAKACAQRDNEELAALLFARCDFGALDAGYRPDTLDMLQTVLSPAEYERAVELHHALAEMAYKPSLSIGGIHSWRIRYQGNRAIKGTGLVEIEYDERQRHPLLTRIRCVSTDRLVPLLAQQTPFLQQDFFRHARSCGGPQCGWCKTRAWGPSVLEYAGEKKTICFWMQRRFTEMDSQAVDLVVQYVLFHEALLSG